jgi:hypothetical protein
MDTLLGNSPAELKKLKEQLFEQDLELKKALDQGVGQEEFRVLTALRQAQAAAAAAVEKLGA